MLMSPLREAAGLLSARHTWTGGSAASRPACGCPNVPARLPPVRRAGWRRLREPPVPRGRFHQLRSAAHDRSGISPAAEPTSDTEITMSHFNHRYQSQHDSARKQADTRSPARSAGKPDPLFCRLVLAAEVPHGRVLSAGAQPYGSASENNTAPGEPA